LVYKPNYLTSILDNHLPGRALPDCFLQGMRDDHEQNIGSDDLLISFAHGGEEGMTRVFHRYYHRLCLYADSIVNDRQAAEDIVQDAFVKIWTRRIGLRSQQGLSTYLYSMIRNACINYLRDNRRRKYREESAAAAIDVVAPDRLGQFIYSETLFEIYTSMRSLPPKCREIFRMLYIQGKGCQEVAAELNVAESTVRVQKARAIAIIKQKLHLFLLMAIAVSLI